MILKLKDYVVVFVLMFMCAFTTVNVISSPHDVAIVVEEVEQHHTNTDTMICADDYIDFAVSE